MGHSHFHLQAAGGAEQSRGEQSEYYEHFFFQNYSSSFLSGMIKEILGSSAQMCNYLFSISSNTLLVVSSEASLKQDTCTHTHPPTDDPEYVKRRYTANCDYFTSCCLLFGNCCPDLAKIMARLKTFYQLLPRSLCSNVCSSAPAEGFAPLNVSLGPPAAPKCTTTELYLIPLYFPVLFINKKPIKDEGNGIKLQILIQEEMMN